MRHWWLGPLLLAVQTASGAAESVPTEPHASDVALAKQLASELKTALTEALKVSAENAIEVCNTRAPQIAATIAVENEALIGRTSLRVRTPANAPNAWQREVLEMFQRRHADGEPVSSLEYSTVVETADGHTERRFMKAIPTEPLCVTCHGRQLAPALQRAIAAKYPEDTATGFDVGDLRGAVYVVRQQDKAER